MTIVQEKCHDEDIGRPGQNPLVVPDDLPDSDKILKQLMIDH